MKASTYKLQTYETTSKNFNEWIIESRENELMGDNIDISEEEKVESILGRKVKI